MALYYAMAFPPIMEIFVGKPINMSASEMGGAAFMPCQAPKRPLWAALQAMLACGNAPGSGQKRYPTVQDFLPYGLFLNANRQISAMYITSNPTHAWALEEARRAEYFLTWEKFAIQWAGSATCTAEEEARPKTVEYPCTVWAAASLELQGLPSGKLADAFPQSPSLLKTACAQQHRFWHPHSPFCQRFRALLSTALLGTG